MASVDESKSAPPLPEDEGGDEDEDEDPLVRDAGWAAGSVGTVTLGVDTVGVGIVTGGLGGLGTFGRCTGVLGFRRDGAFSLRGTSHVAFNVARAALSRWETPLGSFRPGGEGAEGADPPLEASVHSEVAWKAVASATAYGPPWLPNDALPEALPGQRASAYWGCWKWDAAAVCPTGPVSKGLDVPSADGELSMAEWASE
jgi:hypothetical protein